MNGNQFSSPARSEVLTRDGGIVVCPVSLTPGARVILVNRDKQARVRIVNALHVVDDGAAYGVAFVDDPSEDFWGIHLSGSPSSGAGRTVLECSKCQTCEAAELSEIEIMVLEEVSVIGRACDLCLCETLWEIPRKLGDPLLVTGSEAYSMPTKATEKRERTREDRKHRRISPRRAQACIKIEGKPDEIVSVVDFSRGGIRFMSTVDYQPMTRVEVAVPYTIGGANIFVPATIVRVILRARAATPGDYACEYDNV